jgi:hypothetical protein
MNHRNMNPSFRTFRQSLIVFAEPSIAAQPPKGALHHPPPRQHFKAVATQGALDHLEEPAAQGIGPTNQLPAIHAISPDQLEPGEVPLELGQHQLGPLRVLEISPMNHYRQQQSQGVHYDMALAAGDLLARIVASGPPCIFDSSLMVIEHGYRGRQTDAPLVWEGREKAWVASSSLGRARTVAWA